MTDAHQASEPAPIPPCDLDLPHRMLGAIAPTEQFDGAGCPPDCPRRMAWEARELDAR